MTVLVRILEPQFLALITERACIIQTATLLIKIEKKNRKDLSRKGLRKILDVLNNL